MAASDFLELTSCHQPCAKDEVEIIRYTELNYPYFTDGANSIVVVLTSTSVIEIRCEFEALDTLAAENV